MNLLLGKAATLSLQLSMDLLQTQALQSFQAVAFKLVIVVAAAVSTDGGSRGGHP
jgi:hypothetical protein